MTKNADENIADDNFQSFKGYVLEVTGKYPTWYSLYFLIKS